MRSEARSASAPVCPELPRLGGLGQLKAMDVWFFHMLVCNIGMVGILLKGRLGLCVWSVDESLSSIACRAFDVERRTSFLRFDPGAKEPGRRRG